MPIKTIFLDRDGVINQELNYLFRIEDFIFIDGIFEACLNFQKLGYKIIIITNQSGIARKYFNLKDVKMFHKFMNTELSKAKARIDDFFICGCHPNFPKKKNTCKCRKPSKTMLIKAIKKWSLNKKNIFMIGDKYIDKLAAKNAGVNFQYKSKKINLYKQIKSIVIKKFN